MEATNRAYFEELQPELGDEFENYSNLFKSSEEIQAEIKEIKNILFEFDIENAEIFSQQINEIQDRERILALKKALNDSRVLYNLIRMQGDYELLDKVDFRQLNILLRELSNHLNFQWTSLDIISLLIFIVMVFFGDLFMSLIKRIFEIKDTGSLLPGHGGVLDRLDSYFTSLPIFYLWFMF